MSQRAALHLDGLQLGFDDAYCAMPTLMWHKDHKAIVSVSLSLCLPLPDLEGVLMYYKLQRPVL